MILCLLKTGMGSIGTVETPLKLGFQSVPEVGMGDLNEGPGPLAEGTALESGNTILG